MGDVRVAPTFIIMNDRSTDTTLPTGKLRSTQFQVDNKMSSTDLTSTTPTEIRRRKMEKDMVSEYGKCVLSVPLSSLFAGNTVLFAHSEPCQHFTALKQVLRAEHFTLIITVLCDYELIFRIAWLCVML